MARKTTAVMPAPARERIVQALMRLASDRPWNDIEVTDIAEEAGVTLAEFRDHFPSKGAVLGAFSRMIDKQVLETPSEDLAGEPARERVFDVMMRRLDALAPYKSALRRIAYAVRMDPMALAALNRLALNSQRFMLAAAGIATEGPLGLLKLQGAAIVFANTLEKVRFESSADAWPRVGDAGKGRLRSAPAGLGQVMRRHALRASR